MTDDTELITQARTLHDKAPLADLHADTFSAIKKAKHFVEGKSKLHLDLPRMRGAGIWAEAFSIFVHPDWSDSDKWLSIAEKQLARIEEAVEISSGSFAIAKSTDEVMCNHKNDVTSGIIEIEGLHPLGGDISKIEWFYNRGVRIFTLTWNNTNEWATSCMDNDAETSGLTAEGIEVLGEINRLDAIVDLAHSGERTFWDVIGRSDTPPICSHSCCRVLKESSRNLTDDQIRAIVERGGVIGINFYPGFLSSKSHSLVTTADLVNHIEHIIGLGGKANVALGSDFDGVRRLPKGMEDCTRIIEVTKEMLRRGFEEDVILGVLGRNFMRLFSEIAR